MLQENYYSNTDYLQAQILRVNPNLTKSMHKKLVQLLYNAQNGVRENDFLGRLSAWYALTNVILWYAWYALTNVIFSQHVI